MVILTKIVTFDPQDLVFRYGIRESLILRLCAGSGTISGTEVDIHPPRPQTTISLLKCPDGENPQMNPLTTVQIGSEAVTLDERDCQITQGILGDAG